MKYLAGWITSWNQDCQEKYQQPQIWRWYHLNGRRWRGTKQPHDEGESREWKARLKRNIQKTKIMAPTHHFMANRWGKSGNSGRFTFLRSKITVDGYCSHEIKRGLLLGFFFLYSSSVYFCHLFLISSASVRSIPFLSFIVLIFAWNVPLVSLIFLTIIHKQKMIWRDAWKTSYL